MLSASTPFQKHVLDGLLQPPSTTPLSLKCHAQQAFSSLQRLLFDPDHPDISFPSEPLGGDAQQNKRNPASCGLEAKQYTKHQRVHPNGMIRGIPQRSSHNYVETNHHNDRDSQTGSDSTEHNVVPDRSTKHPPSQSGNMLTFVGTIPARKHHHGQPETYQQVFHSATKTTSTNHATHFHVRHSNQTNTNAQSAFTSSYSQDQLDKHNKPQQQNQPTLLHPPPIFQKHIPPFVGNYHHDCAAGHGGHYQSTKGEESDHPLSQHSQASNHFQTSPLDSPEYTMPSHINEMYPGPGNGQHRSQALNKGSFFSVEQRSNIHIDHSYSHPPFAPRLQNSGPYENNGASFVSPITSPTAPYPVFMAPRPPNANFIPNRNPNQNNGGNNNNVLTRTIDLGPFSRQLHQSTPNHQHSQGHHHALQYNNPHSFVANAPPVGSSLSSHMNGGEGLSYMNNEGAITEDANNTTSVAADQVDVEEEFVDYKNFPQMLEYVNGENRPLKEDWELAKSIAQAIKMEVPSIKDSENVYNILDHIDEIIELLKAILKIDFVPSHMFRRKYVANKELFGKLRSFVLELKKGHDNDYNEDDSTDDDEFCYDSDEEDDEVAEYDWIDFYETLSDGSNQSKNCFFQNDYYSTPHLSSKTVLVSPLMANYKNARFQWFCTEEDCYLLWNGFARKVVVQPGNENILHADGPLFRTELTKYTYDLFDIFSIGGGEGHKFMKQIPTIEHYATFYEHRLMHAKSILECTAGDRPIPEESYEWRSRDIRKARNTVIAEFERGCCRMRLCNRIKVNGPKKTTSYYMLELQEINGVVLQERYYTMCGGKETGHAISTNLNEISLQGHESVPVLVKQLESFVNCIKNKFGEEPLMNFEKIIHGCFDSASLRQFCRIHILTALKYDRKLNDVRNGLWGLGLCNFSHPRVRLHLNQCDKKSSHIYFMNGRFTMPVLYASGWNYLPSSALWRTWSNKTVFVNDHGRLFNYSGRLLDEVPISSLDQHIMCEDCYKLEQHAYEAIVITHSCMCEAEEEEDLGTRINKMWRYAMRFRQDLERVFRPNVLKLDVLPLTA